MDSPEGQRLLIAASFGLAANLLFFSLFRYRARVVVATKRAMERLALPTDPALVQVQRARSSDHVSGMQYMCYLLYCSASLQTITL